MLEIKEGLGGLEAWMQRMQRVDGYSIIQGTLHACIEQGVFFSFLLPRPLLSDIMGALWPVDTRMGT